MTNLISYNEFQSLNEYIRHQQYKFIYQHPLFIQKGNKKGLFLISNRKTLIDIRFHIVIALLSSIATYLSIGYHNVILTCTLSCLMFTTLSHGISKFVFTRNKLWKKLEKDFMQEKINNQNVIEMLRFLTIEQKEAILTFLQVKESITFKEMINMFEYMHNKIEKEKIISILKQ